MGILLIQHTFLTLFWRKRPTYCNICWTQPRPQPGLTALVYDRRMGDVGVRWSGERALLAAAVVSVSDLAAAACITVIPAALPTLTTFATRHTKNVLTRVAHKVVSALFAVDVVALVAKIMIAAVAAR